MGKISKLSPNGDAHSNAGWDKWLEATLTPEKGKLTWRDADPEDLVDAIAAATEDGAAVLLSKTSDGGALAVQVWAGTQRVKFYAAEMAQLTAILDLIQQVAKSR